MHSDLSLVHRRHAGLDRSHLSLRLRQVTQAKGSRSSLAPAPASGPGFIPVPVPDGLPANDVSSSNIVPFFWFCTSRSLSEEELKSLKAQSFNRGSHSSGHIPTSWNALCSCLQGCGGRTATIGQRPVQAVTMANSEMLRFLQRSPRTRTRPEIAPRSEQALANQRAEVESRCLSCLYCLSLCPLKARNR